MSRCTLSGQMRSHCIHYIAPNTASSANASPNTATSAQTEGPTLTIWHSSSWQTPRRHSTHCIDCTERAATALDPAEYAHRWNVRCGSTRRELSKSICFGDRFVILFSSNTLIRRIHIVIIRVFFIFSLSTIIIFDHLMLCLLSNKVGVLIIRFQIRT